MADDLAESIFQQMRADFEAVMGKHYPHWAFTPDVGGGYHNERTELAWQGWMACFLHMTQPHASGVPVVCSNCDELGNCTAVPRCIGVQPTEKGGA